MDNKIRINIHIRPDQLQTLQALNGKAVAEHIRDAVDIYLEQPGLRSTSILLKLLSQNGGD